MSIEDVWEGRPALALLAGKEEDRFTVLLCELLRSKAILETFLTGPCRLPEVATRVRELSVATQVRVVGGRPDLVISGPTVCLIFEAKVSAWLHENQLSLYAEELGVWRSLNPRGTGRLFVLAPAASIGGLVVTARQQLAAADITELAAISWEKIAETFTTGSREVRDPALRAAVALFTQLVALRLGDYLRPFTGEEERLLSDPLTGSSLFHALTLLDHLAERLRSDSTVGLKVTSAASKKWQGYTIRRDSRWWWFGLWPSVWAQIGESPLVLQTPGFDARRVDSLPPDVLSPRSYNGSDGRQYTAVPLPIRSSEAIEDAVRRLAEVVLLYVRDLPASGGTGGEMQPTE